MMENEESNILLQTYINEIENDSFHQDNVEELLKIVMNNPISDKQKIIEVLAKIKNEIENYFNNIEVWDGNIDFSLLPITSFNLKKIDGDAIFSYSKITDLNNLIFINGDADFRNSKITDLEILLSIDGNLYLDENIVNKGLLKSIKGVIFIDTKEGQLILTSPLELDKYLNRNLNKEKEDVVIEGKKKIQELSLKKLAIIILGAAGLSAAAISTMKLSELFSPKVIVETTNEDYDEQLEKENDNPQEETIDESIEETSIEDDNNEINEEKLIEQLDKYLEKINNGTLEQNEVEELIKFIMKYSNYFDENNKNVIRTSLASITDKIEQLFNEIELWDENMDCGLLPVTSLGNIKTINGNVNFYYSKIEQLDNLTRINGDVSFAFSKITSTGPLESIEGIGDFRFSQIESLENINNIGKGMKLLGSNIPDISSLKTLGGTTIIYTDEEELELNSLEDLYNYIELNNFKTR